MRVDHALGARTSRDSFAVPRRGGVVAREPHRGRPGEERVHPGASPPRCCIFASSQILRSAEPLDPASAPRIAHRTSLPPPPNHIEPRRHRRTRGMRLARRRRSRQAGQRKRRGRRRPRRRWRRRRPLPRADPPAQVHLAPVHARRHPPEPSPRGRRARPRVVPARPRAASCVAVRHPRRRVPARHRILRAPRHRARPAARRVRRGLGRGVRRLGDVRVRRRGGGVAGRRRRRLRPIGV